ncbi:MAG: hypothetical protein U0326_31915 [Polyangiales bacterium]
MKLRLRWMFLVPGVLLAACAPETTGPRTVDGGDDVAADVTPIDDTVTEDLPRVDARIDARVDASDDVPTDGKPTDLGDDVAKDVTEDTPPTDIGDDVPPTDIGDDVPPTDIGDDVPPTDGGTDVPPVDVGTDVPPTDGTVDVPSVDVIVDVPRPDVPTPDVPSSCALPLQRALTLPSDRAMGTTSGTGRIGMSTCAAVGGPEHVYPLHVAARTGLQLSTEGSMYDTVLLLRRTCDSAAATSEIACNDDAPGGTTSFLRRVVDPGDYFVVVDQYGNADGRGGMYNLAVTSVTPAANADCATPATLTPGTVAMGNTTGGAAPGTACINNEWGPQVFYSLTIPAGQRATVTATPMGTPAWRAIVRAQTSCTAGSCLASGASAMAGAAASEVIDNRGTTPLTVVVSVASGTGPTGGAFSLSAALSTPPTAPANATCSMATAVADGAVIPAANPGLGTTRLNGVCIGGAQGTSLFYSASIPPRSTLEFTATPSGMWDPVIRFLNNCAATSCLASTDAAGAGAAETLRWTNTGTSAQTVYAAVSSFDASASGTFDGRVRVLPPPINTTCASATLLTSGMTLTAQNSSAGIENLTGPCLPTATGTVLYYQVRVGAGDQLTLRARPSAGVDPVIRLLDACGASSCLANANTAGVNAVETLVYRNTGADRTLTVAVGGATNATNGFFDLDVNVRHEYVESSVARACDDMTGGTAVMGLAGDDTVSAIADLPFAFTLYGERELEFAVSSNGLLQLFPSLMGATTNTYDNQPIPTAAAPNRFVAAFWDDLLPVMGSTVTTRTFGTAPARRFVVQWGSFAIFGDDTARLTFQAKLFEGSNAIELHYCTLTPGMMTGRATGDSATIGIESADGASGVQHSHNAAMSVSTTAAIRFTP